MQRVEQGPELSPNDAMVQEAALAYYVAKLWSLSAEERLYNRAAFIVLSGFFAPRSSEPDNPRVQAILWRNYAREQYEQATGAVLGMAKDKWYVWKRNGNAMASRFQVVGNILPADERGLAQAILQRSPAITFNPAYFPESFVGDAEEALLQGDRSSD